MDLFDILKFFLDKHLDVSRPILLGFSGGVDSSFLLNLLLKYKDKNPLDLHVATIDHGWRKQSEAECKIIKKRMDKLNITFHFKKLNLNHENNLEDISRKERLLFFKKLYVKHNFQGILLAHQKDDLVETVLKRVLEGAHLFSLTSMKKISLIDDMPIWRPLLDISRKDILTYLKKNKIPYFNDHTNQNTKFLRAKMRKDIFPYLQKNFNKNILDNLAVLSKRSSELDSYLQKKLDPIFKKITHSPIGTYIDLNEVEHILELKFILKKMSKVDLSRDVLDKLSFWLINKKANLNLKLKNANLYVDRGCFFILKKEFKSFTTKILLKEGLLELGPWHVEIKKVNKILNNSSWRELFINKLMIYVPKDKYYIGLPVVDKRLKKTWENAKIPAFLRRYIPALYHENKVLYDFFSTRKTKLNSKEIWQISLKLK